MKQNKVIQLSEVEHILKRSSRYLGSTVKTSTERYYLDSDKKIVYGNIEYVPALFKLIREILDNCLDENDRTSGKFANKIEIKMTSDTISIKDNGRGIPVVCGEDSNGNKLKETMPELAWTSLRAGSNFEDNDNDTTIGQNGEGSSLVCIWSKSFIGETSDGTTYFKVLTKDNLSTKEVLTKPNKQKYTKVTFKPDLDRMGLTKIDGIYADLLEFDLMFLKETYNVNFKFVREI